MRGAELHDRHLMERFRCSVINSEHKSRTVGNARRGNPDVPV